MANNVALVTGGYRGLGLAIVRSLASSGVTTILTSRDESRGKKVTGSLEHEGLPVKYHRLDVLDEDSIKELAEWVRSEFGRLDILINNAGLFSGTIPELLSLERAKLILGTNYSGYRRVVEAFLPLLKPGSRIINISSASSRLDALTGSAAELKNKLLDVENLTEESIDSFVDEFFNSVSRGGVVSDGWPVFKFDIPGFHPDDFSDYCVSKIAINFYSLLLARRFPELLVNIMCPGLTNTEMSLNNGHSTEEGADTAVWLALECPSSGNFHVKRKAYDLVSIPLACGDMLGDTLERFGEVVWPLVEDRVEFLKKAGKFIPV